MLFLQLLKNIKKLDLTGEKTVKPVKKIDKFIKINKKKRISYIYDSIKTG